MSSSSHPPRRPRRLPKLTKLHSTSSKSTSTRGDKVREISAHRQIGQHEYLRNDSAGSNTAELEQAPLMVRDLGGRIWYWNSLAEQRYGWKHSSALGNISHDLLHTVFPEPLEIINQELISRGSWSGELIHTLADGSRVKVHSTWKLFRNDEGKLCTVLEVNDGFTSVGANEAHLKRSALDLCRRIVSFFIPYAKLFTVIVAIVWALLFAVYLFTPHRSLMVP